MTILPTAQREPQRQAAATARGARRGASGWWEVLLLAAAAVAVSAPMVRLWIPILDEGAMLTGAVKLLRGGVFFRDVDGIPLPGGWYLLAGAMAVFGESLLTARVLDAAIYVAMVVVSYLLARQVLGRGAAVLYGLSLIALKFWGWPTWSAYIYPDPAIAFAMAGMLAFIRSLRGPGGGAAFAAGLLFGAAALCKQTVGICPGLVGLVLLTARSILAARGAPAWSHALVRSDTAAARPFLGLAAYVAGGATAFGIPLLYFSAYGLGAEFVSATVVRPFTNYLPLCSLPYTRMFDYRDLGQMHYRVAFSYFPAMAWIMLSLAHARSGVWPAQEARVWECWPRFVYLLMPLAFAAAAVLLLRHIVKRRGRPELTAAWLALYLLAGAMMSSVFPRADYPHLMNPAPAWLLVLFLSVHLLAGAEETASGRRRRGVMAAAAVGVALALTGGVTMYALMRQRAATTLIELPRAGRVWTEPWHRQLVSIVNFIRSHTRPGEPIFVLGHEAYYYFLCDRYSPWRFAQPFPGTVGPAGGQEVSRLLEKHRVRYVIQGDLSIPGVPPILSYAPSITRYVEMHFRPLDLKLEPPDHIYAHVLERVK